MNETTLHGHKKDLLQLLTIALLIVIVFIALIIIDYKSNMFQSIGSNLLDWLVS